MIIKTKSKLITQVKDSKIVTTKDGIFSSKLKNTKRN